jgi:hypothetical protein
MLLLIVTDNLSPPSQPSSSLPLQLPEVHPICHRRPCDPSKQQRDRPRNHECAEEPPACARHRLLERIRRARVMEWQQMCALSRNGGGACGRRRCWCWSRSRRACTRRGSLLTGRRGALERLLVAGRWSGWVRLAGLGHDGIEFVKNT